MVASPKRVLLGGWIDDGPSEDALKFHLTYEGPLPSTQRDEEWHPKKAALKHQMRQHFHAQLKRLWDIHPALKHWRVEDSRKARLWRFSPMSETRNPAIIIDEKPKGTYKKPMKSTLIPAYIAFAELFKRNGFNFCPLVFEEMDLLCIIDVLFLRRGKPGNLFSEGDVDNRMKTLVDTLRMPQSTNELAGNGPTDGEDPFFCLMADDKFVSRFAVQTDELLDPLDDNHTDASIARLVIAVELRPWSVKHINAHLF